MTSLCGWFSRSPTDAAANTARSHDRELGTRPPRRCAHSQAMVGAALVTGRVPPAQLVELDGFVLASPATRAFVRRR